MFNYNIFLKHLSNRKIYQKSFIKNEIATRLFKRLEFIKINPIDILVVGYQDINYINLIIKNKFPNANIHKDKAKKELFDIIISNSIIHLTDNLAQELDNYYDLLNNDGILLFSTFGDKSFSSMKQAFRNVSNKKHTNDMIGLLTWGNILQSSQYKTTAIESEIIIFTYEDQSRLFKDIKVLNEPLSDTKMHIGFTGKNLWNKFLNEFKNNLQLEIEALYGYAIRKNDSIIKTQTNNRISLNNLKEQIGNLKKSKHI